jgi:hypothetical protein
MTKHNPNAAKAATTGTSTRRKKKSSNREVIDTGTDKRFVRRAKEGQFKESDDVGRSLAQDRRKTAKKKVRSGPGDRGEVT